MSRQDWGIEDLHWHMAIRDFLDSFEDIKWTTSSTIWTSFKKMRSAILGFPIKDNKVDIPFSKRGSAEGLYPGGYSTDDYFKKIKPDDEETQQVAQAEKVADQMEASAESVHS